MNRILILILVFLIISCGKTKQTKIQTNYNLISFENFEPKNREEYKEFKSKFTNPIKIDTNYIEDYIVATTYVIGNECMSIKGDIIVRNDSIILITEEKGSVPCDGISIKKLVFKINNPDKKNYKLGYKGVFYDYNFD